jgi:hypothetical protein
MAVYQSIEHSGKLHDSFLVYVFSWVAVIASVVGSGVSFFVPSALHGLPVMVGSARGTALVILFVAVPLLILSLLIHMRKKSNAAMVLWLGSLLFIIYNSVMLLFAIPYNSLFLVYVLLLSSSFWSIFLLLPKFKTTNFASLSSKKVMRAISVYLVILALLFYFMELSQYIPAIINNVIPPSYAGTGLLTNPSHVLTLHFFPH